MAKDLPLFCWLKTFQFATESKTCLPVDQIPTKRQRGCGSRWDLFSHRSWRFFCKQKKQEVFCFFLIKKAFRTYVFCHHFTLPPMSPLPFPRLSPLSSLMSLWLPMSSGKSGRSQCVQGILRHIKCHSYFNCCKIIWFEQILKLLFVLRSHI